MAYRFNAGEAIPDGVRRIAGEQLSRAFARLDDPGSEGIEETVHDLRKRCKKLRGLVRLVRPAMGDSYSEANAKFRDAARGLSSIRDAHALLATFDDLVEASGDATPSQVADVRAGLELRAEAATEAVTTDDERVRRARVLLKDAQGDIDGWPLDDDPTTLAGGIAKTYGRGRKRFAEGLEKPSDEQLHEWRKRIKYTWYHVRLLRDAAPSVLEPLAKRFHDLSDVLGDDHDLAVLTAQLRADPADFGGDDAVHPTILLIDGRRADLQRRAFPLGARLYAEPPSAFAERMAAYWRAWQDHGDEMEAGEIADLAS
jgi:CHAD domain-containing protein